MSDQLTKTSAYYDTSISASDDGISINGHKIPRKPHLDDLKLALGQNYRIDKAPIQLNYIWDHLGLVASSSACGYDHSGNGANYITSIRCAWLPEGCSDERSPVFGYGGRLSVLGIERTSSESGHTYIRRLLAESTTGEFHVVPNSLKRSEGELDHRSRYLSYGGRFRVFDMGGEASVLFSFSTPLFDADKPDDTPSAQDSPANHPATTDRTTEAIEGVRRAIIDTRPPDPPHPYVDQLWRELAKWTGRNKLKVIILLLVFFVVILWIFASFFRQLSPDLGHTRGEQNGCRQRLEGYLSCQRSLALAVA